MPLHIERFPQAVGIPRQASDTITGEQMMLITGDTPAWVNEDMRVAAGTSFPALQVVGLSGGFLVPATAAIKAIGVAIVGVEVTAQEKSIPVIRQACLNPDALVWTAGGDFDTDAEKFGAFAGAPTPTNIILRRPKSGRVQF